MSTYRVEWPCCGSVTETQAWEPEHCPFCTPDEPAIPASEGAQLPEAAAFIVHRAMCEPALEWSEGDGWRNEPLFTADQMHAYARAALAAPAPQAPVALTDEQESAPLLLWNGGYYIRGRLVVEKSWAANAGSLAEPYFILAPQTKEPTNDR